MILADTGFNIALCQPRDTLHTRAKKWHAAVRETLLVSEYVMWEMVNALSAPVDRSKAALMVERMRNRKRCEFISATPELTDRAIQLHADRPDKEWSLTDCASFLVMSDRGITRALTHDHHFEQAGFEALLRRDPE